MTQARPVLTLPGPLQVHARSHEPGEVFALDIVDIIFVGNCSVFPFSPSLFAAVVGGAAQLVLALTSALHSSADSGASPAPSTRQFAGAVHPLFAAVFEL